MFRNKKKESLPAMHDLDGKQLKEGDVVESLRYELGKCRIIKNGEMYLYESLESGKKSAGHE